MPLKIMVICIGLTSVSFFQARAEMGKGRENTAGGPCEYAHFRGECKILSVDKTAESIGQRNASGGPGYEGYEVKFKFISPDISPDEKDSVPEEGFLNFGYYLRGAHTLRLVNSWYPGGDFIKKYKIKTGAEFDCTMNVIKSGTCSPVDFSFTGIDLNDYREGGN